MAWFLARASRRYFRRGTSEILGRSWKGWGGSWRGKCFGRLEFVIQEGLYFAVAEFDG